MDSVILILVELGALFNYLIGEEDFPQREHFGYACIFISGLFQVPAAVSETAVLVSGQSPRRRLTGLLLAGAVVPSSPQGASQDFASAMHRFGGVHPSWLLQQTPQQPARGSGWGVMLCPG